MLGNYWLKTAVALLSLFVFSSAIADFSDRHIEHIARAIFNVSIHQKVTEKIRNTCPSMSVDSLPTLLEIDNMVTAKTGITYFEFVERAEMAEKIEPHQLKIEQRLQRLLETCAVEKSGDEFDDFQWEFRSALKELDIQLELNPKIEPLKNAKKKMTAEIRKLIQSAEYIVITKTVPLSEVPEWYRSQYFGRSYSHKVVLKILEGWKTAKPLFVGFDTYSYSGRMISDFETRWLLYVNKSNEIIYYVPENEAADHSELLGPTTYYVSRAGTVVRANTKS